MFAVPQGTAEPRLAYAFKQWAVERKKKGDERRNEWKKKARKATLNVGLLNEAVIQATPAWWLEDSRAVYNEPARANRLSKVFAPLWILNDEWVPRGVGCTFITSVAVHGDYNWINLY